jgi:Terminase-like family.
MAVAEAPEVIHIRPQPRQEIFLSSPADIAIYGGAAGGGKTWSLLVEPIRHINNEKFGAVIFRRTLAEIIKEGGMWDESQTLYPWFNARSNQTEHSYRFPIGAKISFAHLQYEKDLRDWLGAQIPLIEFDQLETFSQTQFFYMFSRNRSTSGIRPYIRGTCNPEPGWLAGFLDWWIDEEGYAIPQRSGVIRWMVRENDTTFWADTPEELRQAHPNSIPKSVTFILSTVYDNQILLAKDPGYLANLQALSKVDRARLLGDRRRGGNWKIRPAGRIYEDFHVVQDFPIPITWRRYLGVDYGAVNTAVVWLAEDPNKHVLYLFQEYLHGDRTTKQHVEEVLKSGEAEGAWGGSPSETQQRWDWSDAGLGVQEPMISDVESGIDRVKEAFKDHRLYVFQSCTGIIEEGGSYSRKLDEQGLPMDEIKNKSEYHRLDALRYVLPSALSAAQSGVVSYKYTN